MSLTIGLLLAMSFLISLVGLAALIWAVANRQFTRDRTNALAVFVAGEVGTPDDAGMAGGDGIAKGPNHFDTARAQLDQVSRRPVLILLSSAIIWLVVGSIFGLLASLKMHWPDLLTGEAALTFGRVRTIHLNMVIYGWLSLAGIGVATWIAPRIYHTSLRNPTLPLVGAIFWNGALLAGVVTIALGGTAGVEWLEIPWQIDVFFVVGAACFVLPVVRTALARRVDHIFVSGWYFLGALTWFPVLLIIAKWPGIYSGAQGATVDWWYAHNILGLWLTQLGLGAGYYFISKITGKPIYSYQLSLLGFWSIALFYSQVGIHHLIGGPVPTWVVTLSIVHSIMMFVPVIAVGINQHVTVLRNLWAVKASIALRFVWLGAIMYTAASFQGSLEALRAVNTVTHFTQFTIAHAHLGNYGFVAFVMFGAIYQLMPRVTGRQWPWPVMITAHFWLSVVGFAIYFIALTIGGVLQGLAMLDPTQAFGASVQVLKPYLEARSVGGAMMTLGHFIFAIHFAAIVLIRHPRSIQSAGPFNTNPVLAPTSPAPVP